MYILMTYVYHPTDPKQTSQPNFSKNPHNYVADEVVTMSKKIRDTDLKRSNVIINVKRKAVVKSRDFQLMGKIIDDPSYEVLLGHFAEMYPNQVKELLKLAQE